MLAVIRDETEDNEDEDRQYPKVSYLVFSNNKDGV